LEYILSWRGVEIDGYCEKVSINQVDIDGNAALHYAAKSGLINCVLRLLSAGSIISLVNKDQKTCCEMADEQNFKELAHFLELALVFQPDEELLMNYDGQVLFPNERRQGVLFLSSKSINEKDVDEFIYETISNLKDAFKFDSTHLEVLLDYHSWNPERLKRELKKNSELCITSCNLQMGSVMKDSSELRKKDIIKLKSKSINEKDNNDINEKNNSDINEKNNNDINEKDNSNPSKPPKPKPTKVIVQRENDDLKLLLNGITVTKYHRNGGSKDYKLQYNDDDKQIEWTTTFNSYFTSSKKKDKNQESNIKIIDIIEIRKGKTTDVFAKVTNVDPTKSLSIITSERSLDLVFATVRDRDSVSRALFQLKE
jgi:ankyrin repeat protein